jgi:hypothetical protein
MAACSFSLIAVFCANEVVPRFGVPVVEEGLNVGQPVADPVATVNGSRPYGSCRRTQRWSVRAETWSSSPASARDSRRCHRVAHASTVSTWRQLAGTARHRVSVAAGLRRHACRPRLPDRNPAGHHAARLDAARAGKMRLGDLMSRGTGSVVSVTVYAYDKFSGARNVFTDATARADDIHQAPG